MLVAVVLGGFGETDSGVAALIERDMVAAPQIPITAIDELHPEIALIPLPGPFAETRQLSGRRGVFAADRTAHRRFRRTLLGRDALGEDADEAVVADAAVARRTADDVVGEHGLDAPVVL